MGNAFPRASGDCESAVLEYRFQPHIRVGNQIRIAAVAIVQNPSA